MVRRWHTERAGISCDPVGLAKSPAAGDEVFVSSGRPLTHLGCGVFKKGFLDRGRFAIGLAGMPSLSSPGRPHPASRKHRPHFGHFLLSACSPSGCTSSRRAHGACCTHVIWGKLKTHSGKQRRRKDYSIQIIGRELFGRRWRGNLKSAKNWAVSASRPSFVRPQTEPGEAAGRESASKGCRARGSPGPPCLIQAANGY